MPNQVTQPQTPSTASSLDPQIVNLAKALRKTESGGNFSARGASGEYGAYQFMPSTWDATAPKYGVHAPLDQATPEQQNEVAYKQLADWKKEHPDWNVGNFASAWNAGPGKPSAYLENHVGTNDKGVKYDTPTYAKAVAEAYQQFKSESGAVVNPSQPQSQGRQFVTPPAPIQQDPNNNQYAAPEQKSNGIMDMLGKAADFAFPIAGDLKNVIQGNNQKSAAQILGDTAMSAMWFVPGVGELGEGALHSLPLAAKLLGETGTKIAGHAAANAGVGYGADVASNLQQGKTGADVLTPGWGTVGGGALGALGGAGSKILDTLAAKTPTTQLAKQTNRLKTLQKAEAANSTKATNPIQTLEQQGLIKKIKVNNGKVDASALTNNDQTGHLDNLIEQHSDDASKLVKSMKGTVPLADIKQQAMQAIEDNPVIRDAGKIPQAEAELERRFASYQRSFGQEIPWTKVDDIRTAMNREWNPEVRDVARSIGDATRSMLYNGDPTNTALKSAMANEAELLKAKNFIEKLHGTTVPGGQLGKYFADIIGSMAGGAAGSIGGPFGSAAGTLAGGAATHKAMNMVQSAYFNPKMSKAAGVLQSLTKKPGVASTARTGILRALTNSGQ